MQTIFTSSVIAAFVAGAFSFILEYIKQKKNIKLKYITEERKKWREKIREIANEINNSDNEEDLNYALVNLKMNINAYGYTKRDDILKDGHIWNLIENFDYSKHNIKQFKEKLLIYLSLLVKYDWERAKKESNGNSAIIISGFFDILSVVFGLLMIFLLKPDFFKAEVGFTITVLLLFPILLSVLPGIQLLFESHIKSKKNIYIASSISLLISLIVCSLIYCITKEPAFFFVLVLQSISIVVMNSFFVDKNRINKEYEKCVSDIMQKMND